MELSFWLCFVGFVQVQAFLTYEKVTLNCNPNYLEGNFTTSQNAEGLPTLNININVKKTLNYKIMLKIRVFTVSGKIRRTVLPFPAVNYCDVMSGRMIPMATLQVMIDELTRFGNLLGPCPIVPGQYYMKDYTMDETATSVTKMMNEEMKYLSNFTMTDENSGKPVLITSFTILFTANRSNWQG